MATNENQETSNENETVTLPANLQSGVVGRELIAGTASIPSEAAKEAQSDEDILSEEGRVEEKKEDKPSFTVPQKFLRDGEPDIAQILKSQKATEDQFHKSNEDLAEMRRLNVKLNSLLLDKSAAPATTESNEDEGSDDEWFENPKAAASKLVEEKTQALQQEFAKSRGDQIQRDFMDKHMDFFNLANTEEGEAEVQQWIDASAYRQQVAEAGGWGNRTANPDLAAAEEIIVGYTEFKNSRAANVEETKAARKSALKNASTVTGKGASSTSGKKMRASELRKMNNENYNKYHHPDFQRELMKAYAEGRVIQD